jgi:hypothetical protein
MQGSEQGRRFASYLLTAAGAVLGAMAGAMIAGRLTFIVAITTGALPPIERGAVPVNPSPDLGQVLLVAAVEFAAIVLGSWVGSALGTWLVLRLGHFPRSGSTAVFQGIVYPLAVTIAGLVTVETTGLGLLGFVNTMAATLMLANVYWANVPLLLISPVIARWLALTRTGQNRTMPM